MPTKAVPITPFEVWTRRKPSFSHFHTWGCKCEERLYNPNERKLDLKTTTCHFVGYAKRSKGFRFYYPHSFTRIAKSHNAKFIEDFVDSSVATTNSIVF